MAVIAAKVIPYETAKLILFRLIVVFNRYRFSGLDRMVWKHGS